MNDTERKIGEIFEYKGEWYQTVKSQGKCCSCDFMIDGHCIVDFSSNGSCFDCHRKDKENIIFKKLEKVGEPFTIVGKLYQHYKVFDIDNVCGDGFWCVHNYKAKILTIEIKQNKEDMEEKKQKLDDLVGLYTSAKITYKEFDEKLKTLYADKEECKSSLKEFDLEAAKAGKPVCTRDGRKARIVCFDVKGDICPIIALVEENGKEVTKSYDMNGSVNYKNADSYDLMMLHEKKEGWVNVYGADTTFYFVEGRVYETKEEAIKHINPDHEIYTTTVKIEWEK